MANKYPSSFPCPLIQGTAAEIYSAAIRTPFEGGNTRQRRIHRQIPHAFKLTWFLKQVNLYGLWLNWMNVNGWDWFEMDLPSAYAGLQGKELYPHSVRLMSDLSTKLINTKDGFHWEVTAVVEFMPLAHDFGNQGPAFTQNKNNWIIAGEADDLSTPDWYISPSLSDINFDSADQVVAGQSGTPSAII